MKIRSLAICLVPLTATASLGIAPALAQESTGNTTSVTELNEQEVAGLLRGKVVSDATGSPIPNALVEASGVTGTRYSKTNVEGVFEIELTEGAYELNITHPQFGDRKVDSVRITAGAVNAATISLFASSAASSSASSSGAVEEVVVTGSYSATDSDQEQWSDSVIDVISTEDFTVTGDSTAVEALQRVTGITVVNDKYVYVRGLGERYSNTTFNGATIPSPDPTRRVIPMDLFPTGALESVEIQKTYTPNLNGDFSGGSVQMKTRSIPNEPIVQVAAAISGNSQTTGENGLVLDVKNKEFLGIDVGEDDGYRSFPSTINTLTDNGQISLNSLTPEQIQQAGLAIQRGDPSSPTQEFQELPADWEIATLLGTRKDTSNGSVGILFGGKYKNEWSQRKEERNTYGLAGGGSDDLNALDSQTLYRTENTINLNGLLGLEWAINDSNVLQGTTFYTRRTEDFGYRTDGLLSENDITVADTAFEYTEVSLLTNQIEGDHFISSLGDLEIDWLASFSEAKRDEPDTTFTRYEQQADMTYVLSDTGQSNETSWEGLTDDLDYYSLDIVKPFTLGSATGNLRIGGSYMDQKRDSSYRRFRFLTDFSQNDLEEVLGFTPNIIFQDMYIAPGLWELRETTQPTDNYTGSHTITAGYAMANLDLERWRFMIGARYEDSAENVTTFELINPDQQVSASLTEQDILPAFSTTFIINDSQQLRFAYSQTVNRPDLKELSPAPWIDPVTRYVFVGNPDLMQASITNYDLRWELYQNSQDHIQVAYFYKDFKDPIERVIRLGAGGIRSYANADSATNQGVELSIHKGFLDGFFTTFNGAYIDSNVDIGMSGAQQTNTSRALQGQSDWVVNLIGGYDNPYRDIQASLALNVSGDRISDVGTQGLPDAIEEPAPSLDFTYRHGISPWDQNITLKAKIRNILNPDYEIKRGDEIERSYKAGVDWYVGFDWALN